MANPVWCAGGDDVTGRQWVEMRDELDEFFGGKHQVIGGGVLELLTIDGGCDRRAGSPVYV